MSYVSTSLSLFVFQTEILGKFVFIPVAGPGEGTGGPAPIIFRSNYGRKVLKKFFGYSPPPPLLSQGLDPAPYSSV